MNQPKPKLPIRALIITNVIWWIIIAVGIIYMVRYAMYHDTHLDVSIVATIGTMIIAAALVTTNTILVAITKIYTDQTTRMAEETKAIVDYYYQTKKDELKPQFIPLGKGYNLDDDNHICFHFINIGEDALYVKIDIEGIVRKFEDFHYRIRNEQNFRVGVFNKVEIAKTATVESIVNINITGKDKLLNEYKQTFKFSWKDQKFSIDNSCLPVEIMQHSTPRVE